MRPREHDEDSLRATATFQTIKLERYPIRSTFFPFSVIPNIFVDNPKPGRYLVA